MDQTSTAALRPWTADPPPPDQPDTTQDAKGDRAADVKPPVKR